MLDAIAFFWGNKIISESPSGPPDHRLAQASFNWSSAETSGTSDMRWEQTKKLEPGEGGCGVAWAMEPFKGSLQQQYIRLRHIIL